MLDNPETAISTAQLDADFKTVLAGNPEDPAIIALGFDVIDRIDIERKWQLPSSIIIKWQIARGYIR